MDVYTQVDYARPLIDIRSTFGYCMFLGGNIVTRRCKKQNMVAWSSVEVEFRAMTQVFCELQWMKIILNDLRIRYQAPMKPFWDNKSAINIAHNPV